MFVRNKDASSRTVAAQDSNRESMAGLGLAESFTFSAPRFSPGRPSAQETDHSKALPTLIWAEGGEASPDYMQVQKLCHQRSLNGPAGSALAVSRH